MIVSTKAWQGDYKNVFKRSRDYKYGDKTWIVLNNIKYPKSKVNQAKKLFDEVFVAEDYIDEVEREYNVSFANSRPYSMSEVVEVYLADDLLCHYASDVIPPNDNWLEIAKPMLSEYVAVSPFWENNIDDFITNYPDRLRKTDFGFETVYFSDQAYLVDPSTLEGEIYNEINEIGANYPAHGGNSFEKRVAMWMANTGQKRAVLKDFTYKHITRAEK